MKKHLSLSAIALSLLVVTGCATPIEDIDRSLRFPWALEPETTAPQSATVEQGDIFFTWNATANSTHRLVADGMPLVAVSSSFGAIYCGKTGADFVCYEDRNGDSAFDFRWKTALRSVSPTVLTRATMPEALEAPQAFEAVSKEEATPLIEYKLGLIYNGPVRAKLDEEDLSIKAGFGEFALGWIDGKDAIRDPSGKGWNWVKSFALLYLDESKVKTIVNPLNFSFTILDMTRTGDLTLEYSAEAVSRILFTEKFDLDFEGDKPPEIPQDVSGVAP